jgi:hypothetical protein
LWEAVVHYQAAGAQQFGKANDGLEGATTCNTGEWLNLKQGRIFGSFGFRL